MSATKVEWKDGKNLTRKIVKKVFNTLIKFMLAEVKEQEVRSVESGLKGSRRR